MAAAYAFHIAEAQSFLDGNKRAGLDAALTFLALNGVRVVSVRSTAFLTSHTARRTTSRHDDGA